MASRYRTPFKQRKTRATGPAPKPGSAGTPGAEAQGGDVKETTASWPSAGPAGSMPFNRTTKWPVVKDAAAKQGAC